MGPSKADIYTRTGDDGTTGLFGGTRVPKDSSQVESYGTVDELNAALGAVKALQPQPQVDDILARLQEYCHDINAEIASDARGRDRLGVKIGSEDIAWIEGVIDRFDQELPKLDHFIVPTTRPAAAFLNLARTICRRAERRLWTWSQQEAVSPHLLVFINRLSDLLFTLMRYEGRDSHDATD